LQYYLLGGLRADASELDCRQWLLDELFQFDVGLPLLRLFKGELALGRLEQFVGHDLPATERFEVARCGIDFDPHVDVFAEALFRRRRKREFKRADNDVLIDVLFARQRINQQQ